MRNAAPALTWTVAEVVARCPQSVSVFRRLRMACVGCAMAPFETLSEAAAAYGLEPEMMLRAFRRARREEVKNHDHQVQERRTE